MKIQILSFLTILSVVLVFSSCEDTTVAPQPEVAGIEDSSFEFKSAPDITLNPSGDLTGVTDADALETALNALPVGGNLRLNKGDYFINREIVVSNFDGTIYGQGMSKTTINGVGDNATPFISNYFILFDLPSGSISIEKISFELPDGFETQSTFLQSFVKINLTSTGSDTKFDKVRMSGTEAPPGSPSILGFHPFNAIHVMGDPAITSGGNHVLTNSEISRTSFQATIHENFKDATVEISGNTYFDVKQTLVRILDGCDVLIANNTKETISFGAIVVTQEGQDIPGNLSNVVIRNNDINTSGYTAIEIGVGGGLDKPDFNLLIEKNTIFKADDPIMIFDNLAGIFINNGEQNAVVRKNTISGQSEYGIWASTVDNSSFIKNRFDGLTSNVADYYLDDSDNNIICKKGPTTILDEGIGNLLQCPK